jgi:NAD(P)-dependent dehydrogenase (short-subunit alcohol dehydrogenase family)
VHIDLGGEIALVTASTAGIGLATAKGLAAAGAMVIVNGRTQGRVEALEPGAKVVGIVADASNANGCDALVTQHPYCDILVNNLGIYAEQDFFALPDSEWLRFLEVNVMSGVRLSRAYLPGMIARGWGRIVFISSESALNVPADMIHYAVTKTAQLSVARGLAKRLAGTGVTVNSILPGPTLTEGVAEMLKDRKVPGQSLEDAAAAFVQENRSTSIIQRMASADEVANMVVYACSSQASATTGAALRVDGGAVDTIA